MKDLKALTTIRDAGTETCWKGLDRQQKQSAGLVVLFSSFLGGGA